jgi:hypothetical protein
MQHQKAKNFKGNMCPRRLKTAGGLATSNKLEPDKLLFDYQEPYIGVFR